jgi:hypothetical protein
MPPDSFAAIQAKACVQADPRRDIAYDRQTMALFTAQLNHIYKEYSVYVLLVGTPEFGLSSFHAPPRNVLMFFY